MADAGIGIDKTGENAPGISEAQINRFHERLCMLTDNLRIARSAGRYAVTPGCLGVIRSLVLPFAGVRRACGMIVRYAGGLTRASRYSIRDIEKIKSKLWSHPMKV
jgi:hypothetical protein